MAARRGQGTLKFPEKSKTYISTNSRNIKKNPHLAEQAASRGTPLRPLRAPDVPDPA
jgi:hypothetical protein